MLKISLVNAINQLASRWPDIQMYHNTLKPPGDQNQEPRQPAQRTAASQTRCAPQMIKAAEASAQGLSQPWIELEIHQLEAGCYQGAVTFLDAGNMQLVHERQNRLVHKAGVMPDNTCTLSLAFGRAPALRFSEFRDPKPLFLLPANTEIDILVSGKTETLYICLEQDRLVSTLRQLNPRLWERPARVLRAFQTPDTCQMARELAHLLRPSNPSAASPRSRLSPRDQPLLIDFLARILNTSAEVQARDTADCHARRSAGQYVKRARDFIDACLQAENLPTIADICAHLGISERTLQYAFRDQLQLTPVAYLRIYRLNQVRRALLRVESADTTVTSVATHWGFWHLGKFAQDYRRQFGERPSDSLASGRVAGFLARNCLSAEM